MSQFTPVDDPIPNSNISFSTLAATFTDLQSNISMSAILAIPDLTVGSNISTFRGKKLPDPVMNISTFQTSNLTYNVVDTTFTPGNAFTFNETWVVTQTLSNIAPTIVSNTAGKATIKSLIYDNNIANAVSFVNNKFNTVVNLVNSSVPVQIVVQKRNGFNKTLLVNTIDATNKSSNKSVRFLATPTIIGANRHVHHHHTHTHHSHHYHCNYHTHYHGHHTNNHGPYGNGHHHNSGPYADNHHANACHAPAYHARNHHGGGNNHARNDANVGDQPHHHQTCAHSSHVDAYHHTHGSQTPGSHHGHSANTHNPGSYSSYHHCSQGDHHTHHVHHYQHIDRTLSLSYDNNTSVNVTNPISFFQYTQPVWWALGNNACAGTNTTEANITSSGALNTANRAGKNTNMTCSFRWTAQIIPPWTSSAYQGSYASSITDTNTTYNSAY